MLANFHHKILKLPSEGNQNYINDINQIDRN